MANETEKKTRRSLTERDRLEARLEATQKKLKRSEEQHQKAQGKANDIKADVNRHKGDVAAIQAALSAYDSAAKS